MEIITSNFDDYQRPVGNIEGIPELREKFITIYDLKSREENDIIEELFYRTMTRIDYITQVRNSSVTVNIR